MAFLAPLFLLGLGLLALPIWLHRLETESAVRRPFASAMFLEAADRRIHVQRKLRYFTLLAFRLGLLALIVFAFAKPFLERAALLPTADEGTHLVVVDTSASMQREGAMASAREEATDALSAAPSGVLLQAFAADTRLNALAEPDVNADVATSLINGLSAGAERTDFGDVMAALDRVAAELPPPVTVHLISDFQNSGLPSRFADLATTNIDALHLRRAVADESATRGIVSLVESGSGVEIAIDADESVDVSIDVGGDVVARTTVPADASSAMVELPVLELGDHALTARIAGSDGFAADDVRYAVIERMQATSVPVITRDPTSLSATYIATALAAAGDGYEALPLTIGDFDPRVLSRYPFAIADDLGLLDTEVTTALEQWINGGGRLLAFAGPGSRTLTALPLSGLEVAPASLRAPDAAFIGIGAIDTAHPALAKPEGWSAVRFTSSVPVVPSASDDVLMRLETGTPLLLERRIGQGRLMTWLAGVDNSRNDLPIQPVFVGFIAETARYLSGFSTIRRQYAVGESLVLPASGGQVVGPDGQEKLAFADTRAASTVDLDQAGIYSVFTSDGDYLVATNPDPRELQTDIIDASVLADWSSLVVRSDSPNALGNEAATPETRDFWPWLLALAALALVGESVLANMLFTPVGRPVKEASA